MCTAAVRTLPVSQSKARRVMRIASRLAMHQFLGRCAPMLLPAVRVAQRLQPGSRVARPQHPLGLHPEFGAIPVAPIIQPLPL
jgi:hypothetical protein